MTPIMLLFTLLTVSGLLWNRLESVLLDTNFLKHEIAQTNFYTNLDTDLSKWILSQRDELVAQNPNTTGSKLVEAVPVDQVFSSIITPAWIQTTTESVLDQVKSFLSSKSDQLSISIPLKSLKDAMLVATKQTALDKISQLRECNYREVLQLGETTITDLICRPAGMAIPTTDVNQAVTTQFNSFMQNVPDTLTLNSRDLNTVVNVAPNSTPADVAATDIIQGAPNLGNLQQNLTSTRNTFNDVVKIARLWVVADIVLFALLMLLNKKRLSSLLKLLGTLCLDIGLSLAVTAYGGRELANQIPKLITNYATTLSPTVETLLLKLPQDYLHAITSTFEIPSISLIVGGILLLIVGFIVQHRRSQGRKAAAPLPPAEQTLQPAGDVPVPAAVPTPPVAPVLPAAAES